MTTIVALKDANTTIVLSDTKLTSPWNYLGDMEKLFRVPRLDNSIIGIAGSATSILSAQSFFSSLEEETDLCLRDELSVYRAFVALHKELTDTYYINTSNNDAPYADSQMQAIVVNSTGMYMVLSNREVIRPMSAEGIQYLAIGSGRDFALASISTSIGYGASNLTTIARDAIATAALFDTSTSSSTSEVWTYE